MLIYFTQCNIHFHMDSDSLRAQTMPIEPRLKLYEAMLQSGTGTFCTIDEHFVLMAQMLRRQGKIKDLVLFSCCGCPNRQPHDQIRKIRVDDEGDLLDEPHHDFFSQRLRFLR